MRRGLQMRLGMLVGLVSSATMACLSPESQVQSLVRDSSSDAPSAPTQTPLPSGSGVVFYVSPSGTSSGTGSLSSPWDLTTALSHPTRVAPGDTILLRGGTYRGRFISTLQGAPGAPIIVKAYPGEWPKIDGNFSVTLASPLGSAGPYTSDRMTVVDSKGLMSGQELIVGTERVQVGETPSGNTFLINRGWSGSCASAGVCPSHSARLVMPLNGEVLTIQGGHTWYQGFEVMSSYTSRVSSIPGSGAQTDIVTGGGVNVYGSGVKIINLVIHDLNGSALSAWSSASDSEYYGNVMYNYGLLAPDRGHGHGIYTQNLTGSKNFTANIVLHGFGLLMQQYGSSASGNVNFNWSQNAFYSEGGGGLLHGGNSPMQNIGIVGNFYYGTNLRLGYGSPLNQNIRIQGNYFGRSALDLSLSRAVTVTDNTVYNPTGFNVQLTLNAQPSNPISDYSFDRNTYFQGNNVPNTVWADFSVGPATIVPNGCGHFWFNSSKPGFGYCNPNSWQGDLGYDLRSTHSSGAPANRVVIVPNVYDSKRANIIAYNWSLSSQVSANVSALGWVPGTQYELRNAANFFGDVITGIYDGSGSIAIPMTGHTVALPVGYGQSLGSNRFPEFGAFVLIAR